MREFLEAYKTKLQDTTTIRPAIVKRKQDIRVIGNPDVVYEDILYPWIGIQKGPVNTDYLPSQQIDEMVHVYIWSFHKIMIGKGETTIMGDQIRKGLLDLISAVKLAVHEEEDVLSGFYTDPFPSSQNAQLSYARIVDDPDPEVFHPVNQEIGIDDNYFTVRHRLDVEIWRNRIEV